MKLKRLICAALLLCMVWTAAAAENVPAYLLNRDGTPINIMKFAQRPYSWDAQAHNGSPVATYIENALDGSRNTAMWFGCWNSIATDDIPDISFYFNDATVRDIWIRNGSEKPNYRDFARMGNLGVIVWMGDVSTEMYFPRRPLYNQFYNLQDNYDSEEISDNFIDGYQRFGLPMQYEHVTRIDFYVKGWYEGELKDSGHQYQMWISDFAFLPDSLHNLVNDPAYHDPYPAPTRQAAPTATPVPTPVPTPEPFTGLTVLTTQELPGRSGPGNTYTEEGNYLRSGAQVKALTSVYDAESETWWLQVELTANGELRRIYTTRDTLQIADEQVGNLIPMEKAVGDALVIRSVFAYQGPGALYSYFDKIPAGTTGTVWQVEGLYAQFEYRDANGLLRRVWIPEGALEYVFG